jgi:DNA-binding transcriptional MerR regulator
MDYMRIGELSRRTGVAPELLRAWERRYGLLEPSRSEGGFRLYSDDDLARLAAMRTHLEAGVSAAEAAALAKGEVGRGAAALPAAGNELDRLGAALDRLDDGAAQAAIDHALARLSTDAVLSDVVLPYLAELGERWQRGDVSVAHEHFASNVLRGRLLGLARGWDGGSGPRAVLAGAPGELHDLPLIALGLALRGRGWRITYLGADTPLDTAADTARELRPRLFLISATVPGRLGPLTEELARLANELSLTIAGTGANADLAEEIGARYLPGDPVSEAERLTREL